MRWRCCFNAQCSTYLPTYFTRLVYFYHYLVVVVGVIQPRRQIKRIQTLYFMDVEADLLRCFINATTHQVDLVE